MYEQEEILWSSMCVKMHRETREFGKWQTDLKKYSVTHMSFIFSSMQPTGTRNELISFISDKCTSLFVAQENKNTVDDEDDDYGFKGNPLVIHDCNVDLNF